MPFSVCISKHTHVEEKGSRAKDRHPPSPGGNPQVYMRPTWLDGGFVGCWRCWRRAKVKLDDDQWSRGSVSICSTWCSLPVLNVCDLCDDRWLQHPTQSPTYRRGDVLLPTMSRSCQANEQPKGRNTDLIKMIRGLTWSVPESQRHGSRMCSRSACLIE